MVDLDEQREADAKLTDEEKRENVIRLAFGGNRERFEEFCRVLEQFTPADSAAVGLWLGVVVTRLSFTV